MPFIKMRRDERGRTYMPGVVRDALPDEEFDVQVNGEVVLLYRRDIPPERVIKSLKLLEGEQRLRVAG